MQVVEEVVLGHLQGGVHGRGVRGVAQFLEEGGAVGEQAEAGEGVEVEGVVRAADEEEEVGPRAVLGTEEDGAHGAAEGEEGLLEEVGVVVAGVQEGDAAAGGGGGDFLACAQRPRSPSCRAARRRAPGR